MGCYARCLGVFLVLLGLLQLAAGIAVASCRDLTSLSGSTVSQITLTNSIRCESDGWIIIRVGSPLTVVVDPSSDEAPITLTQVGFVVEEGAELTIISPTSTPASLVFDGLGTAKGDGASGSALENHGVVEFAGLEIVDFENVHGENGGAIYNEGTLRFSVPVNFRGNAAGMDGGALYTLNSGQVIFGGEATFSNNSAEDDGGAVYQSGAESELLFSERAVFEGNSASDSGGAVFNLASSGLTFGGSALFESNEAGLGGGALYNVQGEARFEGSSSFEDNVAQDGGAIMSFDGGVISFSEPAVFASNSGGADGGSLWLGPTSTTVFTSTAVFEGSTAERDGGAIYTSGSGPASSSEVLRFDGASSFRGNKAGGGGGALFASGASTSFNERATFEDSTAADGGAILSFGGASVFCGDGATFTGNEATGGQDGATSGRGGAVYHSGYSTGEASFQALGDCEFVRNTAGTGGAMFVTSGAEATFATLPWFSDNEAGQGAAVHNEGGTLAVVDCARTSVSATADDGEDGGAANQADSNGDGSVNRSSDFVGLSTTAASCLKGAADAPSQLTRSDKDGLGSNSIMIITTSSVLGFLALCCCAAMGLKRRRRDRPKALDMPRITQNFSSDMPNFTQAFSNMMARSPSVYRRTAGDRVSSGPFEEDPPLKPRFAQSQGDMGCDDEGDELGDVVYSIARISPCRAPVFPVANHTGLSRMIPPEFRRSRECTVDISESKTPSEEPWRAGS